MLLTDFFFYQLSSIIVRLNNCFCFSLLFLNSVFCHPSAGDEKEDLELQRRLRSLNWITWEQLEIPNIDFESEAIDKLMGKTQQGKILFFSKTTTISRKLTV